MAVTQTVRILKVFRSADAEQIAKGLAWYTEAHGHAQRIALDHGLTIEQAAGIIAALSPQVSWGFNLEWAELIAGGDTVSRGLGISQNRAQAIRAYDGDPLDILGGPKVRAFYQAILEGGLTDAVVVDRHAYDLAENERGSHLSLTPKRIRNTADNYRMAAKRLNATGEAVVTACQLQAITWITWRARYWSEGAWDGYANDRGRAPEGEVAF